MIQMRLRIRRLIGASIGMMWLPGAFAVSAGAHPLAPSLLELRERAGTTVEVVWKTPLLQATGSRLRPSLPESCATIEAPVSSIAAGGATQRWSVDCGELVGSRIGVEGLDRSRTDTIVRVEFRDGRKWSAVLSPAEPERIIPARAGRLAVAVDYAVVGFQHVISGPAHLLFVFGLLLLVPGARSRIVTISAFTLGHSVTLALAVLGHARVPEGLIELAIAASIFVLAVELAKKGDVPSGLGRQPWLMAGGFGLLHGFGFAGALEQIGLPRADMFLALGAFNVGIEVGQLAFVAVAVVAMALIRPVVTRVPAVAASLPSYVIGSIAAYWLFDRAASLL